MQIPFLTKNQIVSTTNALANTGDDTGSLLGIIIAIVAIALILLIVAAIIMSRRKG